jgi:hypothetical protein
MEASLERSEVYAMSQEANDLTAHKVLIAACLKHRVPFFWRSPGSLLISGKGIRTVLEQVVSDGNTILGLEGFELESSVIHARIDLIFDASRRPEGTDPIQIVSDWSAEVWVDAFLSDGSSGGPTTTEPNRSG